MESQVQYYLSLKSFNDKMIEDLMASDQTDQLERALEMEDYIVYKLYKLTGKVPCKKSSDFLPQEADGSSNFASADFVSQEES